MSTGDGEFIPVVAVPSADEIISNYQASSSGPHITPVPVLPSQPSSITTSEVQAQPIKQGQVHTQSRTSGKGPKTKRTFKVIIIGDANVGKTCLSFRFCNGRFPGHTESTIGVDFRERAVEIDGDLIRVQLWDTAGQERFRQSMISHYYRNTNAVVFVYDITKTHTFKHLGHWIEECRKHSVGGKETPMILIGNKCDIKEETQVSTSDAQRFADIHDMPLFETSAKHDSESDHVEAIFMTLVHKLQQCKPMHVQSEAERGANHNEQENAKNIIKVDKSLQNVKEEEEVGWCC